MSRRRKILLIDHEPAASYMITMILKLNNYDVVPYSDPERALSDFEKGSFDLILMDLDMKGMSGFELYKRMRQIDEKVNVCFMTDLRARHINEFKTSFPDFPSTSLAEKPVGTDDLLEILRLNLVDNKQHAES
jgi:DNA-binding response OmpR family regulator